jgi:hypothetical protein
VVSFVELVVISVLSAIAVAALLTISIRYVFRGRDRLLSGDGGSPALRAMTTVYALALAFVLATALQSFQNTTQQANAEANSVIALGHFSQVLPSPAGEQLRAGLVSYANTVINREFPAMESGSIPAHDNVALTSMYRTLTDANLGGTSAATTANFQGAVQQLSNLTNDRDTRIRAARTSVPELLWFLIIGGGMIVLLGVAAVTFIDRPWPQFFAVASVSVIFAIVALVIVSLQTPFVNNGFFVSSTPMKIALASIAPGASP